MADEFQLGSDHNWWDTSTNLSTPPSTAAFRGGSLAALHAAGQGIDWNVQPLLRGEKGGEDSSSSIHGLFLSDPNQHQNSGYSYPNPINTGSGGSNFHFTNTTPFWNSLSAPRSSFAPPLQPQSNIPFATSSLDEKPKKNGTETSNKRPRSDTSSPTMPANYKVKKEKMGDRVNALQQLVSPFGKTDTASVLSEAIEYIKFLHDQVGALSTPYMRNEAHILHQQNYEKCTEDENLRSRGLCLVPISSTFPMTNEPPVDFWTPTSGRSFQ